MDVTVAKTQSNKGLLQRYVNMYLFEKIRIRNLTGWDIVLAAE